MDNSSLSENEFSFLKRLISIESTGSSPEENANYGTLPYGSKPHSALMFFLDDAASCGMRTGLHMHMVKPIQSALENSSMQKTPVTGKLK